MPQSTFSIRPRSRRVRFLRTLTALAVLLAAAALVVRLVGGDEDAGPIPKVAFDSKLDVVADGGVEPSETAVRAAEAEIVGVLNGWYQRAFVDPRLWGDGTFPEVAELFEGPSARASFQRDIEALTIGELRTRLARVRPRGARVLLTLYFDSGDRSPFAVAAVVFNATGIFKEPEAPVLDIRQSATLYMNKTPRGWRIRAYDAAQKQETPSTLREATP